MCWLKMLPEEPEDWWEQIPISAIGIMPGIFKSRDLWISSQFRGGKRTEKKRKKKFQERKIILHLQKGEHGEIFLKKSAQSDWKKLMPRCWNSFQLPALWVIRNVRLARSCQGQQTVSDSGWAWRCIRSVCLIHTVNIQACILFWNVWKWKETESYSVLSDSLQPHGLYSLWNSPGQKLEWIAFPFSRGSSQPRGRTQVSCIAGGVFTSWATREAPKHWSG